MLAFSFWIYDPITKEEKYPDNPLLRYDIGKVYIPFLGMALVFNIIIIIFEMINVLRL